MSLPIIVRPKAEADLHAAYIWYEERLPGLGEEFTEQVDSAFARIAEHPLMCSAVHRQFRRALLRRFPYAVFYLVEPDRIVVLAVLHQAVDPERWKHLG